MEITAAMMQMYREQGFYLERIYRWSARVGLDKVREQIVGDDGNRAALYARFLHAQSFAQTDPWAERASGRVDAHEFRELAPVEG